MSQRSATVWCPAARRSGECHANGVVRRVARARSPTRPRVRLGRYDRPWQCVDTSRAAGLRASHVGRGPSPPGGAPQHWPAHDGVQSRWLAAPRRPGDSDRPGRGVWAGAGWSAYPAARSQARSRRLTGRRSSHRTPPPMVMVLARRHQLRLPARALHSRCRARQPAHPQRYHTARARRRPPHHAAGLPRRIGRQRRGVKIAGSWPLSQRAAPRFQATAGDAAAHRQRFSNSRASGSGRTAARRGGRSDSAVLRAASATTRAS